MYAIVSMCVWPTQVAAYITQPLSLRSTFSSRKMRKETDNRVLFTIFIYLLFLFSRWLERKATGIKTLD